MNRQGDMIVHIGCYSWKTAATLSSTFCTAYISNSDWFLGQLEYTHHTSVLTDKYIFKKNSIRSWSVQHSELFHVILDVWWIKDLTQACSKSLKPESQLSDLVDGNSPWQGLGLHGLQGPIQPKPFCNSMIPACDWLLIYHLSHVK